MLLVYRLVTCVLVGVLCYLCTGCCTVLSVYRLVICVIYIQVGKLEMVYSLRQLPDVVSVQEERCQVIEDRELCVVYNHVNSYSDINRELARYFSLGDLQCRREIK